MRGNYISPSELLQAQRETGKSYWDLIGQPLTPAVGYNINNPYSESEKSYKQWYNTDAKQTTQLDTKASNDLVLNELILKYNNLLASMNKPKELKEYEYDDLPSFKKGKDKFTSFAQRLGPKIYKEMNKRGVYSDAAYDNVMRQLAMESSYGLSDVALKNHNYGGVGFNGKTYFNYKNDDAFVKDYIRMMKSKYGAALKAKNTTQYAKALKAGGYYQDSLENYTNKLNAMSSMSAAAKRHRLLNPKMYEYLVLLSDMEEPAVSTRVEKPINKEPVVNTPIQTEAPLVTRPEYLESNSLIKKSFMLNMSNLLLGKELLLSLPGFKKGKNSKKPLSDEQYFKIMEDVANKNYKRWGLPNPDAALLLALNDNSYDYRGYYNKYPNGKGNAVNHWPDDFKTVYHPTFSDESIYSGKKSQYNPEGIVGGHWYGETFIPSFDLLTKLKKLPGFKGGKDSGIKEYASNTVPLGRRYWQAQSNAPTILEKKNTWVKQQKAIKDRKDKALRKWLQTEGVKELNKEVKDYLTTSSDNTWTTSNRNPKNPHLQTRVTKGAKSHASWEKEHPVLNTWGNVLGAAPFAVAAAPLVAAAGSGMAALGDAVAATSAGQAITAGLAPLATAASTNIAGAPLYTWADVGLSSLFGTHGIQTAINEGGISPTTALEIAPLGRLAKPIFNKAATAIENYRYPIGRPQVPENFLTVKPQVRTKVGDVEVNTPNMAYRQGNDLGRTYQKYKDVDASIAQHQIEDNLVQSLSARDGKPYINREVALDKAIAEGTFDPAVGIEVDGHPAAFQDTPMYADGYLWYGTPKINEVLESGSLQSGLLVTPKNDAFIIGSNKATPYKGTGSGVVKSKSGITTVTDNGGRLIPADTDNLGLELNNISAYTWEPGYGYRKVIAKDIPTAKWSATKTVPKVTSENAASTTPEVTHFYHGSPVRFDAFSADFIGSGEGGSKVMRGINLWPEEKIANAPKFANIKSPDAPLHLGVSNTPLGGELNPTVYDVSGRGLKLYTTTPRGVKGLSQSDLISQGYDGIQTPNQVTVFPESIGKLSIDKQSTIEEFVRAHPEVERWTPWTTDSQKMQNIIDMGKMSKWTPEQWTAAQDAAIARGDMAEAQRLKDLHFRTKASDNMISKPEGWHQTNTNFNAFDLGRSNNKNLDALGITGVYTKNTDADILGTQYPIQMRVNRYAKKPLEINTKTDLLDIIPGLKEKVQEYKNIYDTKRNLLDLLAEKSNPNTTAIRKTEINKQIRAFQDNYHQQLYKAIKDNKSLIDNYLKENNYDAVLIKKDYSGNGLDNFGRYTDTEVLLSPSQIKLADAVTFDDNGVRIPLGERDNFKLNDIRYGLLPFGIGLTGYGLLNNHKTSRGSARKGNTKK